MAVAADVIVTAQEQTSPLGALVRRYREQRGLGLYELGRRCWLDGNTIVRIEEGRTRRPTDDTLFALARGLGLSDAERRSLWEALPRRQAARIVAERPAPEPEHAARDATAPAPLRAMARPRIVRRPLPAPHLSDPWLPFGELLRGYRLRAGYSQHALAHEVGMNASYVNRLESGERDRAGPEVVQSFARALCPRPRQVDRLYAAAGYLPPSLQKVGAGDTTLQAVLAVLTDDRLDPEDKAEARAVIETILARWLPAAGGGAAGAAGRAGGAMSGHDNTPVSRQDAPRTAVDAVNGHGVGAG